MTLRNNDTQSLKLSNKTIQRIAFVLNMIGSGTLASIILELINVKIVLRRNGKEYVLAHDNLQILCQESMYFAGIEHALSKAAIVLSGTYKLIPLMLDLGYPINLKGKDQLTVEVTTKTGWYADWDANQSSLEVEDRESIGIETCIPFIKSKAISATHTRVVESLGDNITSITLLNTEDLDNSDAEKIFDSFLLTSDKYSLSDNRGRMFARRATQFVSAEDAAARKENFRFVPAVELHGVELTLELDGANNAATKNYIVYRTFQITADGIDRARSMQDRHASQNAARASQQLSA